MREAEAVLHNREEQVMMWKALEEREVHARAQAQEHRLRESEKEIRELKVMIATANPPIRRPPVFGMATPPEVPPDPVPARKSTSGVASGGANPSPRGAASGGAHIGVASGDGNPYRIGAAFGGAPPVPSVAAGDAFTKKMYQASQSLWGTPAPTPFHSSSATLRTGRSSTVTFSASAASGGAGGGAPPSPPPPTYPFSFGGGGGGGPGGGGGGGRRRGRRRWPRPSRPVWACPGAWKEEEEERKEEA